MQEWKAESFQAPLLGVLQLKKITESVIYPQHLSQGLSPYTMQGFI